MNNLFSDIPERIETEIFHDLLKTRDVRIERILSKGQRSPDRFWYDQEENEWVAVLNGSGTLVFEDGGRVTLKKGDCLNIPARRKHRVEWTDPDEVTVWLAVFYK